MDTLKDSRWHLALMGLVQGIVFSVLWRTFDLEGDVSMWVRVLVDLLVALPLLIYATENVSGLTPRSRLVIVASMAMLALLLQEYGFWVFDRTTWGSWFPQSVIPALLLMFIGAHWLMHWSRLNPTHHHYSDLFRTTWRNAILCGLGVGLTGLFWGVLLAGSQLFQLIGIDALHRLIEKSWFAIPATTTVFGLVVSLGLLREELIFNLRSLLLGLLKWFLPLVLLMATVWTLALPFTGVEQLFKARSAAWTMLATVALAVLFANAAHGDGRAESDAPYPGLLTRALSWTWLAVVPVAVIAIWALGLRIGQYDWTAERLWGGFVALLALGYASGYALSMLRPRVAVAQWLPTIASTNRVMAVVTCIGLVALTSPILDAHRVEASRQTQRVLAQTMPVNVNPLNRSALPDIGYLSRTGRWGLAASERISDAGAYTDPKTAKLAIASVPAQLTIIKSNARKPAKQGPKSVRMVSINPTAENAELKAWIDQQIHRKESNRLNGCWTANPCNVFWMDLNADGRSEALLFDGATTSYPAVYTWAVDKGQFVGMLASRGAESNHSMPLLDLLKSQPVETVPSQWRRIKVAGVEFGVE